MLGTLVRETATAPGTGTTVTLTGATAGRRTFVSEFGSAASCFYFITDGTQTEAQIGTVSAGPPATLTRGTPVWTSAAGATSPTRLNFTAAVVVYAQLPGQRAVYTNNSGDLQGVTAAKVRSAAGATTVGEAVLTAANEAAARTAISAANKAGDTLTGDLVISKATPTLALNKPSAGSINGLVGRSNSLDRWRIELGNATAESGSNVGSDFIIARFSDAGAFLDAPVTIYRNTGEVRFALSPTLNGTPLGVNTSASTTLSGTAVDVTGIPSNARRVKVLLNGMSTSGSSAILVRFGTSSSVEATGYAGSSREEGVSSSSDTTGIPIVAAANFTVTYHGMLDAVLLGSNTWAVNFTVARNSSGYVSYGGYTKALSGALDRIRLTMLNGTDTFDAGSIAVTWEV